MPSRTTRRRPIRRGVTAGLAGALLVAACTGSDGADGPESTPAADDTSTDAGEGGASSAADAGDDGSTDAVDGADPAVAAEAEIAEPRPRFRYPDPPPTPDADAPVGDGTDEAVDRILDSLSRGVFDSGGVTLLTESGDVRHAWFVSDLLRFVGLTEAIELLEAFETLTGVDAADDPGAVNSPWLAVTNHLISWDTVAYPGYVDDKEQLFTLVEERWQPFFDDPESDIDWRLVSWGGVFIDDRPLGDTRPCASPGCIPALDDFRTTDAAGGDWYPDDRTVFGVEVGDEALAIPLNIAEIHEMFNFTLGDRRIAMPYCTLCGSAQAYFTDRPDGSPTEGADEIPVLRTSGLLAQSNKVMYDLVTSSVFDTFTGDAVSGPLRETGVVLEELTVVRSSWAEWKADHPDTRIVAEDGGIGRRYALDPLGGRDDDGPIFPIGDVDDRLDVQELVVGVLTDDGTAIAFPSDAATAAIRAGGEVELAGVVLEESGGGLVAVDAATGEPIAAHEAFWFAWSQFHPDTELWLPG